MVYFPFGLKTKYKTAIVAIRLKPKIIVPFETLLSLNSSTSKEGFFAGGKIELSQLIVLYFFC